MESRDIGISTMVVAEGTEADRDTVRMELPFLTGRSTEWDWEAALVTRGSDGQSTSYVKATPIRFAANSLFFPVRPSAQLDREVTSQEKRAIQTATCLVKLRYSLKISLFTGTAIREAFDADCVHRHLVYS